VALNTIKPNQTMTNIIPMSIKKKHVKLDLDDDIPFANVE
jgi:hypothetical protein